MYKSVIKVKPLEEYRLSLIFEDNTERIFDVKPYLNTGLFAQLKDKTLFDTVHISFDTIEWDNGLDMDPEMLFEESISLNS
jgi:hypothetical protein